MDAWDEASGRNPLAGRRGGGAFTGGLDGFGQEGPDQGAMGAQPLDLGDAGHLPWLETGYDDDDTASVDTKQVMVAGGLALLLLVAVVGGVWWVTHRHAANGPVPDGSVVAAPAGPYKQAPSNPGGKTYEGTGDTSFAVSQGQNPPEHLAENSAAASRPAQNAAASPTPAASPARPQAGDTASWSGGVAQIGAFYSEARAEAVWTQLAQAHDVLAGLKHRVATGQLDNGTIYRLQVLTEPGAANALCGKLRSSGVACQVKR